MQTEERGEAYEDPDSKASGDMPGMVVQAEDMLYAFFPFYLIDQAITSTFLRFTV